MGSPVGAQDDRSSVRPDAQGRCAQSIATARNLGNRLLHMGEDSVVVSDIRAAANLERFRGLVNRNLLVEGRGSPRVSTFPGCARFKFGDGRLVDVRYAADISVGLADCNGAFAASALDAGGPTLLRKGAL